MSQFLPALDFVLDSEDRLRSYMKVADAPPGSFAISGINSHAYPADYALISAADKTQRPRLVSQFYLNKFWTPLGAEGLDNQDLANRVMDQAVNGGLKMGGSLLQKAIGTVTVDGDIGPETLQAANALDAATLLSVFKKIRIDHYTAIAQNNPEDAKYLRSWIARSSR